MHSIQHYCGSILNARLRGYGVNKDKRRAVCDDVEARLRALLSCWHDEQFRRTVLLLGREEAQFWNPSTAPLDVRALVVLCVRNSAIEELASTVGSRHQAQVIPDEDMPLLTGEAIEYFSKVDLNTAATTAGTQPNLFRTLPQRFPNAWKALAALAASSQASSTYDAAVLPAEGLPAGAAQFRKLARNQVVASAIDASLDPQLANALNEIRVGRVPVFIVPGFSRLTRNPAKLLAVIDYVLRHSAMFVTNNYAFGGGCALQRVPLQRPPHDADETEAAWHDKTGLAPQHAELLGLVAAHDEEA